MTYDRQSIQQRRLGRLREWFARSLETIQACSGVIERYWTMCGPDAGEMNDENGEGVFTSRGAEYLSMNHNAVAAGVLVALLLLFAAATGGAVAELQDGEDDENEAANGTFGAEVSSFMQASTADAETEVDEGMFQAGMRRANSTEERRQLIEARQARLAARHAQLEEQRDELSADQPNPKNRAVATRVQVGAQGVERAADSTQEHAVRAGIDTSALNELRTSASELRGEVADLARELGGNDRAESDRSSDRGDDPPGRDGNPGRSNGTDQTVDVSNDGFDDSDDGGNSSG